MCSPSHRQNIQLVPVTAAARCAADARAWRPAASFASAPPSLLRFTPSPQRALDLSMLPLAAAAAADTDDLFTPTASPTVSPLPDGDDDDDDDAGALEAIPMSAPDPPVSPRPTWPDPSAIKLSTTYSPKTAPTSSTGAARRRSARSGGLIGKFEVKFVATLLDQRLEPSLTRLLMHLLTHPRHRPASTDDPDPDCAFFHPSPPPAHTARPVRRATSLADHLAEHLSGTSGQTLKSICEVRSRRPSRVRGGLHHTYEPDASTGERDQGGAAGQAGTVVILSLW